MTSNGFTVFAVDSSENLTQWLYLTRNHSTFNSPNLLLPTRTNERCL